MSSKCPADRCRSEKLHRHRRERPALTSARRALFFRNRPFGNLLQLFAYMHTPMLCIIACKHVSIEKCMHQIIILHLLLTQPVYTAVLMPKTWNKPRTTAHQVCAAHPQRRVGVA